MDWPIEVSAGIKVYFAASSVVVGTYAEITMDAKKVADSSGIEVSLGICLQ